MSVRTVCLVWHWQPYKYTRGATDVNGARVLDFPDCVVRLGRHALRVTGHESDTAERYTPDTALVNLYDAAARLGMHQDKDETTCEPWCRSRSVTADVPVRQHRQPRQAALRPARFGRPVRVRRAIATGLPRRHEDP